MVGFPKASHNLTLHMHTCITVSLFTIPSLFKLAPTTLALVFLPFWIDKGCVTLLDAVGA